MSGLDQVFIKAFENESRRAADEESTSTTGAWRRIERVDAAPSRSAVPAPHAAFVSGGNVTPRRVSNDQRTGASPSASSDAAAPSMNFFHTVSATMAAKETSSATPPEPAPATIAVNLSKYPVINVASNEKSRAHRPNAEHGEPAGSEESTSPSEAENSGAPSDQRSVEQSNKHEPSASNCAWQVVVEEPRFDSGSMWSTIPGAEVIDWTESLPAQPAAKERVDRPLTVELHVEPGHGFEVDEATDRRPAAPAPAFDAEARAAQAAAKPATTPNEDRRKNSDSARTRTAAPEPQARAQRDKEERTSASDSNDDVAAPPKPGRLLGIVEQLQATRPQSEPDDEPGEFVAAWEVDRFQWPSICEQLMESDRRYFQVAGQRLREAAREGLHALGVTAANRGEGQTSLVLCLAKSAAAAGLRVAVIDADADNPQVALRLGLGVAHGWEDFAGQNVELSECAVQSVEDKFAVIPIANSRVARGHEAALANLLRMTAKFFDLVIVDMGALSGSGGRLLHCGDDLPIDAAIVVRDVRSTVEAHIQAAVRRLKEAGVEAVGVAENFGPRVAASKAA